MPDDSMFVVTESGAVHSVTAAHGAALLKDKAAGFREATPEEVAAWYKSQGLKPPKADPPKDGA